MAEAVTEICPATLRAAPGYLESTPNLPRGQKVCPESGTWSSEAQVQCRESGYRDSASSPLAPPGSLSLCPFAPEKVRHSNRTSLGSQTVSYPARGRAAAGIDGVRLSLWELRSPETSRLANAEFLRVHIRPSHESSSVGMRTSKVSALFFVLFCFCLGLFFWGAESHRTLRRAWG